MRAFALLAVAALVACGDEGRPPPPPGGGAPPGTITTGQPDGGDGGLDGGGDGGDGGEMDPLSCITATPPANSLTIDVDNAFTPTTAYTIWSPDECAANRELAIGLTDAGCSLIGGNRVQVTVEGSQITNGTISQGVALQVASAPVLIRAIVNTGEVWGNCAGSSGTITFTSLTQAAGGSIVLELGAGTLLTTCSGPALTPFSVSGRITATVADDCEDA